jgi:hypothetical protein
MSVKNSREHAVEVRLLRLHRSEKVLDLIDHGHPIANPREVVVPIELHEPRARNMGGEVTAAVCFLLRIVASVED